MPNDFANEFDGGGFNFGSFSDVDKLLANREPLYVRNMTKQPIRMLIINYPTPEGERAFNIPRSPVPFNICDFVDPESLRSSASFRAMMNGGAVELVATPVAKAELQDPEKRRSFVNAYNEANKTHQHRAAEMEKTRAAASAAREEQQKEHGAGAMKNMITAMDPNLAKALNITNASGQRPEPKLLTQRNMRLAALEARAKAGTADLGSIMQELSLMLGDLSLDDLQAIAASAFWPVEAQKWARERVAYETKAKQAIKP